jgi:nucleoside-diphosphate-sugar epimerase
MKQTMPVTGGAGVLGSHLCERLLVAVRKLLCIDKFFTGIRRNIEHVVNNSASEVVRHDITFHSTSQSALIYGVACLAPPVRYQAPAQLIAKTSARSAINRDGSGSSQGFKLPEHDPKHRQSGTALAGREFGWTPKLRLRNGLKATIAYFGKLLGG